MKNRVIQIIIAGKDRLTGVLGKVQSSIKRFGALALKGFAVAGAGITALGAGLVALGSRMAGLIDEQAKVASSLGIANEALGAMRDAANMAGISNENLTTGLRRMAQGIAEAADGTGAAKDALEKLGLSADQLKTMKPEQAFSAIVAELDKIPNGLEKTALAMDLFGRSGSSMTNLTIAGLRQAQADAETLGLKLTTAQARGVEAANDAWTRIKTVAADFLKYMTATLAPKVASTLTAAFEFLKTVDFKAFADRTASALLSIAKSIANGLPGALNLVLSGVERVTMAFTGWKLLWIELSYQWANFMGLIWTGLNETRKYTNAVFDRMQETGFISKNNTNEDGKRIAEEQKMILQMIDETKKQALQTQQEEIKRQRQQKDVVEEYRQKISEVEKTIASLGKVAKEEAQQTKNAESGKVAAVNSTTAAIDRQIAAYRRLRQEQGRAPSQGSVQYTSSPTSIDKSLEEAERTE